MDNVLLSALGSSDNESPPGSPWGWWGWCEGSGRGVGGTPVTSSRLQSTAVPEYRHYRFNREAVCQKKMLFKNLKKCSSFMEFMSTPPPYFRQKFHNFATQKMCSKVMDWVGPPPPKIRMGLNINNFYWKKDILWKYFTLKKVCMQISVSMWLILWGMQCL